jgi:hypothetical protein
VQVGLSQVLWQYAMRTQRNLMPTYFRSGPLYWCRAPQLPQRLFRDSHLMIGRELAQAPTTFAELCRRTGLPEAVLSRDLAGLRIVGAVTHDRKQAQRARSQAPRGGGRVEAAAGDMGGATARRRDRSAAVTETSEMTAPAPLTPQY